MELLSDQMEEKHLIESKPQSIGDNESDKKRSPPPRPPPRKNSSDSDPVKTKPQHSSDLIRIFGGTHVPNNEISDSDMESEEERVEEVEEEKKDTTKLLQSFKGGLAKKIGTLAEDKKGGRIGQLFRCYSLQ